MLVILKAEKRTSVVTLDHSSVDSDDNVYILPNDLIAIENVSVKDTSDDRYKRIKRLVNQPHYILEDVSPWVVM